MDIRKAGQELNNALGGGVWGIWGFSCYTKLFEKYLDLRIISCLDTTQRLEIWRLALAAVVTRRRLEGTGISSAASRTQIQCSSRVPADRLNQNKTRNGCDKNEVRKKP